MVDTATAPVADPAEVAANAAAEAQEEAALDRIVGSDATTQPVPAQDAAPPAPTDGRVRDASGKFASKTKETSPTESTQESEPTAASNNDVNAGDSAYNNAFRSLQKDKVPQKVLDSLSHDEIVAWGDDRAKNHLDIDRIKTKNAELERAAALVQGKSEATAETKAVTIDDDTLSEFVEIFGDEAAEPLRKFGESIVKKVMDGLGDQRKDLQTVIARMQAQEQVEARKSLSDRYDLSEEQRWQAVTAYMDKDANTHTTAHDAVLSACRQLFADEPHPDAVAAEHQARDNGQPTTEHRATPTASAPTLDDLEDHLIDAIEDGDAEAGDRIKKEIRRRTAVPLMFEGKVGVKQTR